MKKSGNIYRLLFAALVCFAATMTTTSCRFEEDDYFDESASLRVEHAIDSVRTILTTAENGWVMQYFCGTGVKHFEGFNLFARFTEGGKVTLAGNHRMLRNGNAGKYTEAASLYSLLLEDGPVLAFNTWNDVLTPFVDPVSPWSAPNTLVKDGEGMKGDNNFVIMSYSDDQIIMRGERYQAEVRLTKCPTSWTDYIADTDKMKNYIANTSVTNYYVTDEDGDTLYFQGLRGGSFRYCENLTNAVKVDSLMCVFTPKGFRVSSTAKLGDNSFHEFTLSEDSTCLYSEDNKVKVEACWDNYVVSHTDVWDFDVEKFSTEQKSLYDQLDEELKVYNKNCSLANIGIGKSSGSGAVLGLVVTFYTNTAKTKTNTMGLTLDMSRPAYGLLRIVSTPEDAADRNMTSIASRAENILPIVRSFAATLNGVYEVTPNSYFLPTGGDFKAISGGTTFKLD